MTAIKIFCYRSSSFVCTSAYANVYSKTTILKQNPPKILIAGVPSSQVLLGFLITAPPSVCAPDAIGALAVWIQNQKKKICVRNEPSPPSLALRRYSKGYCYFFFGWHTCLKVVTNHNQSPTNLNNRKSQRMGFLVQKNWFWLQNQRIHGKNFNREIQTVHEHWIVCINSWHDLQSADDWFGRYKVLKPEFQVLCMLCGIRNSHGVNPGKDPGWVLYVVWDQKLATYTRL